MNILSSNLYSPISHSQKDKNVYEEISPGQFRVIIQHLAQVTDLGEINGKAVSSGLDGFVRYADGFCFESQMPVIR